MNRTAPATILVVFAMLMNITVFGQKSRSANPNITIKEAVGNPVEFKNIQAYSDGRGAWLKWTMAIETKNFGFYIYKVNGGQKQLVTDSLIPGSAARIGNAEVRDTEYSYYDIGGGIDSVYIIESQDMNSRIYPSNPVSTTYVNDLKPLAGYSSDFLAAQRMQAAGSGATDLPGSPSDTQPKITAKQMKQALGVQRALVAQDGVKIAIRKAGMYRVSRAQLQGAGFDVNSDSAMWQIYAHGVQQAMLIGGSGDYIEFYGKGVDEIESDTQIYYLVVGAGPGLRIGSRTILPVTALTSANFQETAVRAPKKLYINTILNGDDTNFFGPAIGNVAPSTINFNLFGVDFTNRRNPITIEIQGFSLTPHSVSVVLNGLPLGPITGSLDTKFSRSYVVSPGFLREGANALELMGTLSGDINLFSSITIDYRRKYLAEQNQLYYLNESFREVDVNGFSSSNIRIFDMTDNSNPIMITGLATHDDGGTFSIHIPQYRSRVMMGVEDSGLLQPASVLPNNASDLSATTNAANLVIVSYKDWMPQAEAWADYRRGQGFGVKVVDVEDIYDEFSFGTQNHLALKAFFQYTQEHWATAPQYALLLGDASYDPRNFEGNGFFDYVPSKIVNTLYTEVPSDDALVDFNHDGLAEISIGRIPGRSAADMTRALQRVQSFEQPAMQSLNRGVIIASDFPNGYDFEAMSVRISLQLPDGTPVTYINRANPDGPILLLNGLNNGPYAVNYAGHGTVGVWADSQFFGNSTVPALRNSESLSVFTMLTCLNGYFINPTTPVSLAENLINAQWTDQALVTHNTGAVAAWASTGLTTPIQQEVMATRFYNKIGTAEITRMGDLVRDAKSVVEGDADVRNSWVLLGDPMLKVR